MYWSESAVCLAGGGGNESRGPPAGRTPGAVGATRGSPAGCRPLRYGMWQLPGQNGLYLREKGIEEHTDISREETGWPRGAQRLALWPETSVPPRWLLLRCPHPPSSRGKLLRARHQEHLRTTEPESERGSKCIDFIFLKCVHIRML